MATAPGAKLSVSDATVFLKSASKETTAGTIALLLLNSLTSCSGLRTALAVLRHKRAEASLWEVGGPDLG